MDDKKTLLLEAAIDLFSKEGFWNTSTARISKHARVATGTLFNYFPSKEALIDEVYVTLKHELLDAISTGGAGTDDPRAYIEQLFKQFVAWGTNNPVRYSLLEQLRISDLVSQEVQQKMIDEFGYVLELIERGIKSGTLVKAPQNYLAYVIFANAEYTVRYARDNEVTGKALNRLSDKGFTLLWKGITP